MSSTFDTIDHALQHLERQPGNSNQTLDIIHYLKAISVSLHDLAHSQAESGRQELNFAGARNVALLQTALKHSDDEKRKSWLNIKSNT